MLSEGEIKPVEKKTKKAKAKVKVMGKKTGKTKTKIDNLMNLDIPKED